MRTYNIPLLAVLFIFFACSSSQETTQNVEQQAEDEIYVFDAPVVEDSVETQEAETEQIEESNEVENVVPNEVFKSLKHIVQVGAYETRVNAEKFVYDNLSKINYPMEISYSENVKLYVIWLPGFNAREDAERVRNELWLIPEFKDAFILTIEK